MKKSQTPRFEVDFQSRIKQSKEATNAVRMPRLGYALYRVYDIEKPKDKALLNSTYGLRKGPMNVVGGSVGTGKSYYNIISQYNSNWQQVLWAFIDELESKTEPPYDVRWLKPKHVTLLQMKGHRVELAQLGDKSIKQNSSYAPVKLGA